MSDVSNGAPGSGRTLVVWRHGRTGFNTEHRFQGHLDPPLDEVGRGQAASAARVLAGLQPAVVVSSDLSRAAQTAAELVRVAGTAVVLDRRLREYDVGAWEGLTRDEIASRFPTEYEAWRAGLHPESWESMAALAERATKCIEEVLERVPAGDVLVTVAHGGALRAVIGALLGLPQSSWPRLAELGNCHWSVLAERAGGWTLLEHNSSAAGFQLLGRSPSGELSASEGVIVP